jgi:hypothetical protein
MTEEVCETNDAYGRTLMILNPLESVHTQGRRALSAAPNNISAGGHAACHARIATV